MFTLSNPIKNPFNEFLKDNGLVIALSIAALLVIVVATLLILNKKKER